MASYFMTVRTMRGSTCSVRLVGPASIFWVVDPALARAIVGFFSGAVLFQITQRLQSSNIVFPRLLLDVVFIATLAVIVVT